MPPAISDDESSDVDAHLPVASWREDDDGVARPARRAASAAKPAVVDVDDEEEEDEEEEDEAAAATPKKATAENGDDDDDEDDEEGDEDEDIFIVEAIKKHMIDEDGSLKFHVKWEGYDKKADMTWEPEENLEESANEVLEEYFNKIGGRDSIFKQTAEAASGKKRGRKSAGGAGGASSADAAPPTKRSRKSNGTTTHHPGASTPPAAAKQWSPPAGSWEDEVERIDACHLDDDGNLLVYLVWKNGKKTRHKTGVIYAKCPQKMLQFYERHIKIVKPEGES